MSKLKLNHEETRALRNGDVQVRKDSDVIRCICNDISDDGFTIQCDKCGDWQHALCMNIMEDDIPEHYVCKDCAKELNQPLNVLQNVIYETFVDANTKVIDRNRSHKKSNKRSNIKKNNYWKDDDDDDDDDDLQHITPKLLDKKFIFLAKSIFKQKLVQSLFLEVRRQWTELNKSKLTDNSKIKVESSLPSTIRKNLETIVVMESNLLLPAIPKTSVRPLRKSLRKSFHQQTNKEIATEKGVFADIHIPEQRYLMEVTGELLRKSRYKNNPINKFSIIGTPLAHIFFYRAIDVCIDARYAGNDARYIRRSCCPNSEIKNIILPNDNNDRTIHMGIYTCEEIDKGEEITIGWNWHKGVLLWHKNKEFLRKNHTIHINASEREPLKEILKIIEAEFGECACEDKDECLIECLKDELEKDDYHQINTYSSAVNKKRRSSLTDKVQDNIKHSKKFTKTINTPRSSELSSSYNQQSLNSHKDHSKKVTATTTATATITTTKLSSSSNNSQHDKANMDIATMVSSALLHSTNEMQLAEVKKVWHFYSTDKDKLPCKKRWLAKFALQQQKTNPRQLSKIDTSSNLKPNTTLPETKDTSTEVMEYDYDDDLSDGISSQSTLPLEDTPENVNNQAVNLEQSTPFKTKTKEDYILTENSSIKALKESIMKMDSQVQLTDLSTMATNSRNEKDCTISESTEAKKSPKKLSIQEYLSMRRGNLSTTPFEKI
ncbi:uncharacterized protein BX663DRAFT_484413 [Cokeromyces recurvatus]|uniref:uncharacterized protein n=1 Tax=Cokeromyces recurvatus TaxID=90255 RepID=UPI00221EC25B|nr:uncharacterized protein BX663DRAFT_484413 [Cokeromyces recurvatus]KAI7905087.1 hypothetical protein BX663DRAFT_484413 [Cokeromyces recurvatus]